MLTPRGSFKKARWLGDKLIGIEWFIVRDRMGLNTTSHIHGNILFIIFLVVLKFSKLNTFNLNVSLYKILPA